jgi:hypothetical protein
MAFFESLLAFFLTWIDIFIAPFRNLDMLWIIIPIYLNWFFAELFQEKKGTSFGNAISNGVVVLWVGIDWIRTLFKMVEADILAINSDFWLKIGIAACSLFYGLTVIIWGNQVKKVIHYIGRIRVITYILLMFTPLFYEPELFTTSTYIAILVFAPLFYFIVYLIDWAIPDPKVYAEDEGKPTDNFNSFNASNDTMNNNFFNNADKGDPFGQKGFDQNFGQPQAGQQGFNQQQNLNQPGFNFYKNH